MAVVYDLEHAESYNTTDLLHCSYLFSHWPPFKIPSNILLTDVVVNLKT